MSTTTPLLGRCKECDFALFTTRDNITDADSFREVRQAGVVYQVGNNGFFARCPERHKVFMLKAIKGTYSPDHKCDARCLNAKGHTCTCSCGGANHGRGYAIEVTEAVAPVIRGVEPATEKQLGFVATLLNEREVPASEVATASEREASARDLVTRKALTKTQASATIKWLLTLPRKA